MRMLGRQYFERFENPFHMLPLHQPSMTYNHRCVLGNPMEATEIHAFGGRRMKTLYVHTVIENRGSGGGVPIVGHKMVFDSPAHNEGVMCEPAAQPLSERLLVPIQSNSRQEPKVKFSFRFRRAGKYRTSPICFKEKNARSAE